ncbi:family 20 glycosylhydrolase [Pontibacter chitinilyticus]|uniref:family 20 glycosylhydrolase n=1 Tax=Pontibacter chitinilyticus TaxID=2674989 RepID=UPI00321A0F5F
MKQLLAVMLLIFAFWTSGCAQVKKESTAFQGNKLQVTWELADNNYNNQKQALWALTLTNTGQEPFPADGWSLFFNGSPSFKPMGDTPVELEHVNGDLLRFTPTAAFSAIPAGGTRRLEFISNGQLVNSTNAPKGFYLVWDAAPGKGVAIGDVTYKTPDRSQNEKLWIPAETVYHQNESIQDIPAEKLPKIFPTPVSYKETGATFTLTSAVPLVVADAFKQEGSLLADYLGTVLGKKPAVKATGSGKAIQLKQQQGLGPEGYKLQVSANEIVITASTPAGAFYGVQSLKTLLPPSALGQPQSSVAVAGVNVTDSPRFGHRAFMLDVARNFHSKEEVLKVLDLMGLYKLNVFHFHLTDDEGWRLEIPGLPELTEIGGKRAQTLDDAENLVPSYGSGATTESRAGTGYYSRADFIEILKYAAARHIMVLPEIESPGHARAAIKAMDARYKRLMQAGKPEEAKKYLLRDLEDKSKYQSVQNWDDNVIDVAQPSTYAFLEKVVDEMLQMYKEAGAPIKTVHFGGDEVPRGVWEKSPAVEKLIAQNPKVKGTDDLWFYYYGKVNDLLKARNLYLSGWEEIGLKKVKENGKTVYVPNPQFANENFHVDVWNNLNGAEDLAYKLANAGYKTVLTNVTNLYFDLSYQRDYDEKGLNWGGYLDIDKPFYFIPFDYLKNMKEDSQGNPVDPARYKDKVKLTEAGKGNIVGLQGALWSETLTSPERMEYMLLPKLLALAERAWAPDPAWSTEKEEAKRTTLYNQAWSEFVNVLGKRELPRLSHYHGGFEYRIPTPGAIVENGKVVANLQLPGLEIRYTTDGSEPTQSSKLYQAPVPANGPVKLKVFTPAGRAGRTITVQNQQAGL